MARTRIPAGVDDAAEGGVAAGRRAAVSRTGAVLQGGFQGAVPAHPQEHALRYIPPPPPNYLHQVHVLIGI